MADSSEVLKQVKGLLVERLFLDVKPEDIGDDENLIEKFGIDSVRIFEVVVGLEETFGLSFADEDFDVDRFSTPKCIAEVVASKAG
ncbi:MAG: acyl carrier protein [Planctomycetota bacterium]